jgi:hypothetical protein
MEGAGRYSADEVARFAAVQGDDDPLMAGPLDVPEDGKS